MVYEEVRYLIKYGTKEQKEKAKKELKLYYPNNLMYKKALQKIKKEAKPND